MYPPPQKKGRVHPGRLRRVRPGGRGGRLLEPGAQMFVPSLSIYVYIYIYIYI